MQTWCCSKCYSLRPVGYQSLFWNLREQWSSRWMRHHSQSWFTHVSERFAQRHNDSRSDTHSREPVAIIAASKYNRQLYTSFGVGRSSTARNPPMMLSCLSASSRLERHKTNAPVTIVAQWRVQEWGQSHQEINMMKRADNIISYMMVVRSVHHNFGLVPSDLEKRWWGLRQLAKIWGHSSPNRCTPALTERDQTWCRAGNFGVRIWSRWTDIF